MSNRSLAVTCSFKNQASEYWVSRFRCNQLIKMAIRKSVDHPNASHSSMPRSRYPFIDLLIGAVLSLAVYSARSGSLSSPYTDPKYQTGIAFGAHSHWIQPWRAYLETVPATRFLNGLGVVLSNIDNADLVLEHLARNGIKLTRIEIGWGNLNYDDESLTSSPLRAALQACKNWGIRPILLLNSNHGIPCPVRVFTRTVTADAPTGATTVQLNDTTGLVLGRSGLSNLTSYWAAEALITAIDGNTVTLSKPLPKAIAANTKVSMATLKYRPFSPPGTDDYVETIGAWQRYVQAVANFAADALGTTSSSGDKGFDLEVWNELTFGSNFLYINAYYQPALYKYNRAVIWGNLLKATASLVQQDPAPFSGVQLADGFASTIPWPCSSKEPIRIDAICKHPYPRDRTFPSENNGNNSLNAELQADNQGWVPTYRCRFPEYAGTAIQTEHVIRDMSPIATSLASDKHGRYARVVDGRQVECDTWITEIGYDPHGFGIVDIPTALNLKAKATARLFCFYLQKGASKLTLFGSGAGDREYGIVQDDFLQYLKRNKSYPANDSLYTSPALKITKRIVDKMNEGLDTALTATRALEVTSVSDAHDHCQFNGDGTAVHPPLYDRDVLAILPFQVNAGCFVIPYYVMTRDLTESLVPEAFTVGLKGVNAASVRARVYDPLNDRAMPTTVDSRSGDTVTATVEAADYPYLLILEDGTGT
jgi:hypothetical protein